MTCEHGVDVDKGNRRVTCHLRLLRLDRTLRTSDGELGRRCAMRGLCEGSVAVGM
jgi:hypothetical protein